MAAFTTFSRTALERYLIMYDLGDLHSFEAIGAGIENSNYFVRLGSSPESDEYVLTITEDLSFEEVPFFNDLLNHLVSNGLPAPAPQRTLDGMTSTIFCGKPTWLFPRLAGQHPAIPTAEQCRAIGACLARMHLLGDGLRFTRNNAYGAQWAKQTLEGVSHRLSAAQAELLSETVSAYAEVEENSALPRGVIHGDMFLDNALFEGDNLTGVIDFYHACEDFLVQDIAITLNDWAVTHGKLDRSLADALVGSYNEVRPLLPEELVQIPVFRRFAAMRFALTRLISGGEGEPLKDPGEFLALLETFKTDG